MEKDGEHTWLEEVEGESALTWVKDNNEKCLSELGDPTFKASYQRVLSILDSKEKIPQPRKIGAYYYNFWQDAENPRGLWRRTTPESYRQPEPEWEVVLDVDALGAAEGISWVYAGHTLLEEEGGAPPSRTLMKLSRGGSDANVVREFDLVTKTFVEGGFELPEAKSRVSWVHRDLLLVGTDLGEGSLTDSGYPRQVREWARGTPLKDAPLVYEGEATDVAVSGHLGIHAGHAFEWRRRSTTFYTSKVQVRSKGGTWADLDGRLPDDIVSSQFADQMLLSLRSEWLGFPTGTLLSIGINDFIEKDTPDPAAFQVLFMPSERISLQSYSKTKSYLILQQLDTVKTRLRFWRYTEEGLWVDAGEEAEPSICGAYVGAVDSDTSDEFWFRTETFTEPSTLFLCDAALGPGARGEELKSLPAQFDATGLEVSQAEATSADGTKVPYFLVMRKGSPRDGKTPTLLFGYGGFEVSLTPGYPAVVGATWLEEGGAYAMANIRGGGEFGPAWHQAALKEKRQAAYDDFIAVAEHLCAEGVTSPSHLGIRGGSNGGLLMGNMFVQRPDLFGAVVCAVPLLDMRRFHKLLAGASWMAEYGNPDTDDWNFMKRYSAYHNLDPDAKYPPFLMTTSTRDDRVHPYHARAFVKRLADIGKAESVFYYENIEGGHGGAADSKQQAFMTILYIEFLKKTIGAHKTLGKL